ncbi:MAG: hypothetical protein LBM38_00385 [Clostridiales bacterium]|jgi:hypothetical protein|nr:hypothetical protein [Clostridiales bacterium]
MNVLKRHAQKIDASQRALNAGKGLAVKITDSLAAKNKMLDPTMAERINYAKNSTSAKGVVQNKNLSKGMNMPRV